VQRRQVQAVVVLQQIVLAELLAVVQVTMTTVSRSRPFCSSVAKKAPELIVEIREQGVVGVV
jgi:hypothetical protein